MRNRRTRTSYLCVPVVILALLLTAAPVLACDTPNPPPTPFACGAGEFSLMNNTEVVGCVAVTNGWWITDGAAVNLLSAARETDMGYGAAFHENRVQVERARGR